MDRTISYSQECDVRYTDVTLEGVLPSSSEWFHSNNNAVVICDDFLVCWKSNP